MPRGAKVADEAQIQRVQDLARQGNAIDPALEVRVLPVPPPPTTWYGTVFRAVGFQMVIVALLAFAGPGMVSFPSWLGVALVIGCIPAREANARAGIAER